MLETIRDLMHRQPFSPFSIVTTSGDRYEVENPDLVALLPAYVFYAFPRSNKYVFIRMNQIVAVEAAVPN